jgi:hypothetical protein
MASSTLLILVSSSLTFPLLLYTDPRSGMLIWQLVTAARSRRVVLCQDHTAQDPAAAQGPQAKAIQRRARF